VKVLVLGAGVIGVTTAYYLAADGHEVTVVDRQPGPGLETSFANAGNVCPSYATPWAAPGMRWKAAKWLLEGDAPLTVHWRADASLVRWAAAWLANCSRPRFERNKRRMQRLSHYSLACLQTLRATLGLRYDETTRGILQLLRTERELAAVTDHTRILEAAGNPHKVLDPRTRGWRSLAGCTSRETRPETAACSPQRSPSTRASAASGSDSRPSSRRSRSRADGRPGSRRTPGVSSPTATSWRSAAARCRCSRGSAFGSPSSR
jgi:glycine/D-amino acid oxidase-like deaminating enzyme